MIIKKFQGKTEEEAMQAAKRELGNAVVVMNVKNVKKKGIFSIFKSQMIEVTVALEEEPVQPDYKSAIAAVNEIAKNTSGFESESKGNTKDITENLTENIKNSEKLNPQLVKEKESVQKGIIVSTNRSFEKITRESGNATEKQEDVKEKEIEEKLENLQNLIEKQIKQPEKETQANTNIAFFKLLYNVMLENEIDEKYANQLIDDLDRSMKPNMPVDFMLSNVYQKMILKFSQPKIITPADKGPKLVFFIGPTGVGKTTTIAKIASKFRVEQNKKVALLTADTYRIAAAEQLRTYANILEVPFRVIYTSSEVQTALKDFYDYDYILVDTAGHSHHNESQKENMNELIHSIDYTIDKEVYLVVSATTKYRDLLSIADTYMGMTDYKLIFTKLDETTTLGNMLNLKLHTGAAMSYVTCGQNVPDDIDIFDPQKTVKMLLGGNRF